MPTVPILVTDDELAALEYTAARYKTTVPVYVMLQLTDFLSKTVRLSAGARWEARRKQWEAEYERGVVVSPPVAPRHAAPVKRPRRPVKTTRRKGR